MGVYHYRLTTKYLKGASCALQAGQLPLARTLLDRGEESLRRNPDVAHSQYDHDSIRLLRDSLSEMELREDL